MKTEKITEGFIKLTDRFYVKPCEAVLDRFDLYEFKKSKSKRHPGGKMDDVAFGMSLISAVEKVCFIEASTNVVELQTLLTKLKKTSEEIITNITKYLS